MYFGLFLFLAWVVPLVAGTILMASFHDGPRAVQARLLFSVSPIAGTRHSAAGAADERRVLEGRSKARASRRRCSSHSSSTPCWSPPADSITGRFVMRRPTSRTE